MYITYHVLFGVLGASCVTQALSRDLVARLDDDFRSFGQSLGLTSEQLDDLGTRYTLASANGSTVDVACLTARAALGENQVQIQPINASVIDENWSQTCWIEPHCIIQPQSSSNVSTSLRIVDFFSTQFAVRSGGHSPNPGWSSIGREGMLLDLQLLNSVLVSSDGTFAGIEPGARWSEVYAALDVAGAVVAGGRTGTIGVGGLVLGGGFSHLSNQFGLVADNVKSFEVSLANGSMVTASSASNTDLFWALKGGGPNFGIVTRYDIYTLPVDQLWVQINAYTVDEAHSVLSAYNEWQLNGSLDVKSNIEIIISLDYVAVILIYSEPLDQPPAALSPFFNSSGVQPAQISLPGTNITYNELSIILGSVESAESARHDYRAASSRIDLGLTQTVYDSWRQKAADVRNMTGANQTFVLQYVGPNLIQQGTENGGNPLNIPSGAQQWWTTTVDWTTAADDDLVRSVSIDTAAQWMSLGSERGSNLSFVYMNDASRDQNPLMSYGMESVEKLKQVAERYDPTQVFQTLQNGGFKLASVEEPDRDR